ncbi:MAG: hydrogenase expression/formation protein HypE [Oscillospiraceae bacterium]|nr:hydrogenase expression/formation protein HypE [Oscillospiraceae bacterium]
MEDIITLDYGSGGMKTSRLIERYILGSFGNTVLNQLGDGAVLGELAFSTDSFVVDPLFFPGGDIGKLAVCGTVNDLAMCGAEPQYLSCAMIIEEGLPFETLERVLRSMGSAAEAAGVQIVTGDTKVVEKGRGDGLYLNTAGIGTVRHPLPGLKAVVPGDAVLVSGTVGDHGTAVMLARSGMMEGEILSDCCPLNRLTERILSSGAAVRILRDPTRGGVATTLNEFTERQPFGIELTEECVPIRPGVRAACEMLGLDPLYCANEGKLLAVCAPEDAEGLLEIMGPEAAQIGTVTENAPGRVVMRTGLGGRRILQKLAGAQLPRIC